MTSTLPGTSRITLTLSTRTLKALRMLALLKEENQNKVAEDLLIAGGLHAAVETQWRSEKPFEAPATLQVTSPKLEAALAAPPTTSSSKPITKVAPIPVKPEPVRLAMMSDVPKPASEPDPEIPW